MVDKICEARKSILKQKPVIHCITNPISINQCANAILSMGGRPIMAEHPMEVSEITATADALMLNLGNITDARMESIMLSFDVAIAYKIPVLLDVVGIACSGLRREFAKKLLNVASPSVIKGNYSEIMALYHKDYCSRGVDAEKVSEDDMVKTAMLLASKYKTVILATGKTDIITDGTKTVYVKNGTPSLTSVTGTGCMLGSLCTTFLAVANPMDSAVFSCCYFGICGELADIVNGYGSFMVNLMDNLSTLKRNDISKYMNMEELR